MEDNLFRPYFTDKRAAVLPENALRGMLYHRQLYAQELIGVFVTNVRVVGHDGDFLNTPVPIDEMDQSRLFEMKLIEGPKKRFIESYDDSEKHLSKLGFFVVEHAVLTVPKEDASLPTVDAKALDISLADGFSSRAEG